MRRWWLAAAVTAAVGVVSTCSDDTSSTTSATSTTVRTTEARPTAAPIDAWTRQRIVVDGDPDYLVATADAVWVKRDEGRVARIDPSTGAIVADVRVAEELCQGLVAAGGAVWSCGDDGLVAIDPASNTVTTKIDVLKVRDEGRIGVGFGSLWVLTGDGSTLTGLDPTSGEETVSVALGARCSDVLVVGDGVWVSCLIGAQTVRVDPRSRRVTARIRDLAGAERAIAAGDGTIWIGYRDGVVVADSTTGALRARIHTAVGEITGIAVADGTAWLRAPGRVVRIDTTTLQATHELRVPEPSSGDILVAFGSVWTSAYDDDVVYRLSLTPPG